MAGARPRLGGLTMQNDGRVRAGRPAAADNMLGDDRRYAPVPYFWTDRYDIKIQMKGVRTPGGFVVASMFLVPGLAVLPARPRSPKVVSGERGSDTNFKTLYCRPSAELLTYYNDDYQ
ncbi:hypothetical protein ACFP2T_45410 [Plantactinospora solaniradicis]|uniref:Uncharacterized protein n=1 Tax=Plantactinospora solaniradicis TaxID=1723736 RepID=A0ABW1KNI4_9ACTN